MTEKIKCAIFGLGNQAKEHLKASINHPDIEIVAAIEQNKKAQSIIQESNEYKALNLEYFDDLEAFQKAGAVEKIDALILALPHHVYGENGFWATLVEWKKPLLKEKPLGRNYEEAREFMEMARKNNCGLQTAIQRREHPTYKWLGKLLREKHIEVEELHATYHLGLGEQDKTNWRGDRKQAGGGALLDAGYHLVDLVQFLVGDVDIISSVMWDEGKAHKEEKVEDHCWLTARSNKTWVMLDIWRKGVKTEKVVLKLKDGSLIEADREAVLIDGELKYKTEKNWLEAMREQLSTFAKNVRNNQWEDDVIWEQLPAMRKIEEAYNLASNL